jgi:hypothetical protein
LESFRNKLVPMNPYIITVLLSLLLVGCGDQLPPDSYQLKVTELFSDEGEIVTALTVETAQAQEYSIRAEDTNGAFGCNGATGTLDRDRHQGRSWIVGSRVAAVGSTNDYAKILVRSDFGVAIGQGSIDGIPIPKRSKLREVFSLMVRDGIYRCDTPLVIGQVRGTELKLSFRQKTGETKKP